MADPITLGTIAIAGSAAGGGLGIFSALMGGDAKSKMFNYQAGVAQLNQKIAKSNADYARKVGEVEATQAGMKSRFIGGKIIAAQSRSGVDVGSGSNLDVQEGQRLVGQMDQGTIRNNAARRAYGHEVEAMQQGTQSDIYKMSADNAETAGYIGAATSFLSGATSVSSKWLQGNQLGLWDTTSGSNSGDSWE